MSNTSTQIEEVVITPIAIGDPPLLNAAGLHAPYALRNIVEVRTKGNVTGIAEVPGGVGILHALQASKELLIGADIFQFNLLAYRIKDFFQKKADENRGDKPWDQRKAVHVISAFEVASLDVMGKELNRRVAELLGGVFRERVPFAAYLFYKHKGAGGEWGFDTDPNASGWEAERQKAALSPEDMVRQAVEMCRYFGFKSIKLKGGVFEPKDEVAAIRALAQHFGPQVPLRFDPNAVWAPETARRWGKVLEPMLDYLEDPVRGQQEMADLRKELKVPLATNMCTTSFGQIKSSVEWGSEDIILSDHHFWGGLRASMDLYKICTIFGRGFSMHSNSHLGISLAAMVHLGAALPVFAHALDTHYPWQIDEVIEGGKIQFEDGMVQLPKDPGLGVTINQDALKTLHENYLRCGLKERNDEVEMQKVIPGWKFMPTRF